MNNALNLSGAMALVTGASRGIGAAVARRLASTGCELLLAGRSKKRLAGVAGDINESGGSARSITADLANADQVLDLVRAVRHDYGRLDILVNNAGIAEPAPLSETTVETWDRHMAINARAPFIVSTGLADLLSRSDDGVIVNIGSVVSHKGYVNQGAYVSSKHAMLGLTKVLARELHPRGVRVHLVSPGGVATDMITGVRPDIDLSELIAPDEIAKVVEFLIGMDGVATVDEIEVRRRQSEAWK